MLTEFIIGAVAGSFVNVMVIRGQRNEDYVLSRSRCPVCGHVLEWFDLIPLLSYVFLKGKCRYCQTHISIRYLFVEVIGGILGLLSNNVYDFLIFMVLLAIALYDHDTMEIRNSYIIFLFAVSVLTVDKCYLKDHLIGAFLVSVPMLIMAFLFKGFGGADVKLMSVCGFWLGTERILLSFIIGCLTASGYSLFQIIKKKKTLKSRIPFAPFLSLGIIIGYLYGFRLIDFYEMLI